MRLEALSLSGVSRRVLAASLAAVFAASAAPALAQTPAPVQAPQLVLPEFAELVERVGPAVVNIRTLERGRAARQMPEMDENLEEFFRRFGIPLPGRPDPRRGTPPGGGDEEPTQRGVGSGFILSADGYVMTNTSSKAPTRCWSRSPTSAS
jgi:serine protease Do